MKKIIDFVKGQVAELAITEDAGKKIINYIKSVEGECYECNPPEWKECPFCGEKQEQE